MKTRMRTRNATKIMQLKIRLLLAQGSPRTVSARQTDGWMETRLPISDRATLNGIYLDPNVEIDSEPKTVHGKEAKATLRY